MNSDGQSLCKASGNGHLDIVNFLVEKGADVNSSGMPCFFNNYICLLR